MTPGSGPHPRVLVFTEDCDPTADVVLARLNERGVQFWRVDPGDFLAELGLSAIFDGTWSGALWGQLRAFGRRVGRIITKSLAIVNVRENEQTGVLYTAEVPEADWNHSGIAATAHLFQELVPRLYEVRMTFVAGQCFATAMEPNDPDGPVDIRAHSERVTHTAIQVPDRIVESVSAMMDRYGLVFGTFDFIVRPDGHWVFLELNPNGQWAWTEHAAGLPISIALADLLEKGATA
jgi:hypothetical protein